MTSDSSALLKNLLSTPKPFLLTNPIFESKTAEISDLCQKLPCHFRKKCVYITGQNSSNRHV